MCISFFFAYCSWWHPDFPQNIFSWTQLKNNPTLNPFPFRGITTGWNPAPVDRSFMPLFTGFYTSQVVGNGISSINSRRKSQHVFDVGNHGFTTGRGFQYQPRCNSQTFGFLPLDYRNFRWWLFLGAEVWQKPISWTLNIQTSIYI